MNTILLTVRSKNGQNLDSATPKVFVVEKLGTVQANQNPFTSASVTEAGDASNQMSAWVLNGTPDKLYWTLALNAAGDREVSLYRDSTHNALVARGSKTGDGIVYFYSKNESGIFGNVTVAYSVADGDVANTVQQVNFGAMADTQLYGESQFDYTETNGAISMYTVDETYATIQATIAASTSTVTEISGTLSTAEITSLNGTPVAAIPSPGAGYAIAILGGAVSYTRATATITGNTTIDLVTTTTGTIVANAASAVSGASSKVTRFVDVAGVMNANEGISLKMNTGDPTMTTSTGTCTYTILYAVYAI